VLTSAPSFQVALSGSGQYLQAQAAGKVISVDFLCGLLKTSASSSSCVDGRDTIRVSTGGSPRQQSKARACSLLDAHMKHIS